MAEPLKISIVTPSFNQAEFLEETIRSVLGQGYPKLEYMVFDGGSTDGSVEIIRRHERDLAYWVSRPDGGQYDAINQGLARATGDVMAWINSDDKYTPWALGIVGEIFARFPQIEWLTTCYPLNWDRAGLGVKCYFQQSYDRWGFLRGENLPGAGGHATGWIQQESTFWRRSLWEKAGGKLDLTLKLASDFELWARFFQHATLYAVATPLAGIRNHGDQKSARQMDAYLAEARQVLERHGGGVMRRGLWQTPLRRVVPKPLRRMAGVLRQRGLVMYWNTDVGWKLIEWTE